VTQGTHPIAEESLPRIGRLYDIEKAAKSRPPDQRRALRQDKSRPIFDGLIAWWESELVRLPHSSRTASAIRYALKRRQALSVFLDNGHVEIDNNAAERAMRPIALGRKNWLFAGSHSGGERAASMLSLIESAKMNGLDPEHYLRHVLSRIADYPINRIEERLPWNVKRNDHINITPSETA